jgi:cell division protein FtsI/penicillin-binding protein 2
MVAALVVLAGLLGVGFQTDFGAEASAEPVVQAFLLDWQQGHYTAAAQLTTGDAPTVSGQLLAAFRNLDATEMFFSLKSIQQHGNTAEASFTATMDIAGGAHQWTYEGQFGLVSRGGHWLVSWAPSVIQPSLGPGDRLAVVTKLAPRAMVTDVSGSSLIQKSTVYYVGVYPGKLASVRQTATEFSQVMGLNERQVLGQISAAPPKEFLSLVTLDPASFGSLWPGLSRVRGLVAHASQARLFNLDPDDGVGKVGTENSPALRDEGAAYQPGATIGLSGLERAYQDTLAGTPDVAVIVVNAQGKKVSTLWTSPGMKGLPLRTTIDGRVQSAANAALASVPTAGEIVAVNASTGHIVALAGHDAGDLPLPAGGLTNARISPGITFTIISSAALLAGGLPAQSPLPCLGVANVGGQRFTYTPGKFSSGAFASDFASDFAAGCGTAFATVSLRLTSASLVAAEKAFGIGQSWDLRIPGFSGSAPPASGEAGLAAQAIGSGGVLVSPLAMAMVAAEVDAGVGHTPALVASDPPASWQAPLSTNELNALRGLMRTAVESGPARVADLPGTPVHGQVGVVQTGPDAWLSWFVGYRGSMAFTVLETGHTQSQAAASLAASFLSAVG